MGYKRFDYCVSNPPYQVSTKKADDKNNNTKNIYPFFYEIGYYIASVGSMIFPGGRWMQRAGKNISYSNFIYSTVGKIYWYSNNGRRREVFPNAIITDGLSIVEWDRKNVIRDIITLNDYSFPRPVDSNDILPLNRELNPITRRILENHRNISHRKYNSQLFKLPSFYVERNPIMVRSIEDNIGGEDYVRAFLGNSTPGSAKRVKEYWLNKNAIIWTPQLRRIFSNWKVVGTAGDISKGCKVRYRILENNTAVGESWIIVGDFSTREEAINYMNYLNSTFSQVLAWEAIGGKVTGWGKFIPDLEDYSNANSLFTPNTNLGQNRDYSSMDLDDRLYDYFNLSPADVEIIKNFEQ